MTSHPVSDQELHERYLLDQQDEDRATELDDDGKRGALLPHTPPSRKAAPEATPAHGPAPHEPPYTNTGSCGPFPQTPAVPTAESTARNSADTEQSLTGRPASSGTATGQSFTALLDAAERTLAQAVREGSAPMLLLEQQAALVLHGLRRVARASHAELGHKS